MKKILIIISAILSLNQVAFGQNNSEFKPSGKPVVTIYTDFNTTSTNDKTNYGYNISRSYFGYKYSFSPEISGKVVFDASSTSGLKPTDFTIFLKNAFIEYSKGKLEANLGMIGVTMYKVQENTWGRRYLYKSFQDEYGFMSSADLGASVKYQINKHIGVDLQILNGEGYKKVQSDSTLLFGVGLTAEPIKNITARVYADIMKKTTVAQQSINAMLAFKNEKLSLAAEYNLQNNYQMIVNKNFSGVSIYGTYNFNSTYNLFARYDKLMSNKIGTATSGWNARSGELYIFGFEFKPAKGVQIAPNFRLSNLEAGNTSTSFYLNIGLNI